MSLWKLAAKLNKETAYVRSGYWVEPFPCCKKKYFPCLLDHFSTSLFDKKIIQQREISDTLSSVSSKQLEGRTGEVSFNNCLAYYIIAQPVAKVVFKCAHSNTFFLSFQRDKKYKGKLLLNQQINADYAVSA